MSVSPEGLVYICDSGNHRVTVHDEEGMFLFAFLGQREVALGHLMEHLALMALCMLLAVGIVEFVCVV